MKSLNERFTDEEWIELLKYKGKRTWHDAIIYFFSERYDKEIEG